MPWTRPFRSALAAGEGLFDRLLCVMGAVLFSQIPEFMQQYLQRLGGHLDEARRQLDQLRDVAAQSGVTLEALIANTSANPNPAVARLGEVIRDTAGRVDTLAAASQALQGASAFTKPFVLLAHFDPEIARATWSIFRPAVPTTVEGLVYALAGMVVLLAVYHGGVRAPVRRAWRARAARREAAAQAPA
jgi:hypothetical protein